MRRVAGGFVAGIVFVYAIGVLVLRQWGFRYRDGGWRYTG